MNRRTLCSLALAGLLASGTAFAQEPGSAPEQAGPPVQGQAGPDQMDRHMGGMRGGPRMDPDQRLAHMTKRYKLTADQQSQLKPILADQQQQMEALRADTATAPPDKWQKMRTLRQAGNQKIEAVLTDDQRKKFESDQQKMEERRADRMSRHGVPDGGAAPPAGPDGGSAPPPPPDGGSAPPPQ